MAAITAATLAATLVVVLQQTEISTVEIDQDRAAIQSEIAEAKVESEKYAGGLIKTLLDLRIAILRNTMAMLDQKRTSFIRRISLNYMIEGHRVSPAGDNELNEILEELVQAERKVTESKREAEQYTGGLLQAMLSLKVATDELSVSQLRLKFYSAKYGIPMLVPMQGANSNWFSDFETPNLFIQLSITASDSSTSGWRLIYENKMLRQEFKASRRAKEKGSL
jgi:hypothetical protein